MAEQKQTITARCEHCGKQFAAPVSMLGKRVRCRGCGEVFEIATAGHAPSVAQDNAAKAGAGRIVPIEKRFVPKLDEAGQEIDESNETEHGDHAPLAPLKQIAATDQTIDLAGPMPPPPMLQRPLLDIPFARELDEFLPIVLTLISFGWVLIDAFRSNETAAGWVPVVRAGVFATLFAGLIFPMVSIGVRSLCRSMNIPMLRDHRWRIFSSFAFPAAMAWVFWSLSGGFGATLAGLLIGLVVGLFALMVLTRLRISEVPKFLGAAAIWFVGGVLISMIALVALNLIAQVVMKDPQGRPILPASPLASHLPWPVVEQARSSGSSSITPEAPRPIVSTVAVSPKPTEGAANPAPTNPAPTNPAPTNPTPANPALTTPSPDRTAAIAPPQNAQATAPFQPTGVAPTVNNEAAAHPKPIDSSAVVQPVTTNPPQVARVEAPKPRDRSLFDNPPRSDDPDRTAVEKPVVPHSTSPSIATSGQVALNPIKPPGTFTAALLPALASKFILVSRKNAERDVVEIWCTDPVEKKSSYDVSHEPGEEPSVLLSPNGKLLCQIKTFPRLCIFVQGVGESAAPRLIDLNTTFGHPELLFFSDDRTVGVFWQQNTLGGIELFDVITGESIRKIDLAEFTLAGNPSRLSPDGRLLAVYRPADPARPNVSASILLMSLKTGKPARAISLGTSTFVPTAMAFSPDARQLSAVFETQGQFAIRSWSLAADTSKTTSDLLLSGVRLDPPATGRLRPFDYTADGKAFVLAGEYVIDSTSGRQLIQIGAGKVAQQWVVDTTTINLVVESTGPGQSLVAAKFSGR